MGRADIIFSTIHGSRLYGLSHSGSDMDIFTVDTSKSPKVGHRIREDEPGKVIDVTTVGLDLFLRLAMSGSPQSVEALFSPRKMWINRDHQPMLDSIRIAGPEVFEKYEREVTRLCYGDFKRRRHACRLSFNLHHLRQEGRFNPEMSEIEVRFANAAAETLSGERLVEKLLA